MSGRALLVQANLLSANGSTANGGGGILANAAYSRVAGNTIVGAGQFGIDCGGSVVLDVSANHISGAAVGINPGGSQGVRVAANTLQDNFIRQQKPQQSLGTSLKKLKNAYTRYIHF